LYCHSAKPKISNCKLKILAARCFHSKLFGGIPTFVAKIDNMRSHPIFLLAAVSFCLWSCESATTAGTPDILLGCTATLAPDASMYSDEAATFSVSYPGDWLLEIEEKPNTNARNYLFADTSLFFTEKIINTLQVNVQEGELPGGQDFMEANIQELKRRHKVLESGVSELNGTKSYWFLIEDPTITTLMYNLSGNGNFYTINLSTTASENSSAYLCEMSAMLKTFRLE